MAEESNHINLVLDEDRARILKAVFQTAITSEQMLELAVELKRANLHVQFLEFFDEFSDKIHEKNWCRDKNCKWKTKK